MPETLAFASGSTTERGVESAVHSLTLQIRMQSDSPEFDLACVFLSSHFASLTTSIADRLRKSLNIRLMVGCTCEGVISRDRELESQPAISMVAARMPNVQLVPFALNRDDWDTLDDPERFRQVIGAPVPRLFMLIGDSFSMPTDRVLDAFNNSFAGIPIVGGMASGASHPGGNELVLNDRAFNSGAIGVALGGDFAVDVIVSQGCRPFGQAYTVTESKGNVIERLDGQPPLPLVQSLIDQLSEQDREILRNGLFVGRAINPDKSALGRGDYVIRTFIGADPASGSIAVGDYIRTGETIQFHLRDQNTAEEDLEMLLMPQALDTPPSGGLLFSCNGRGTRLFDHPNGDISIIQRLLGGVDLAGSFCTGEIGPMGGKNFLHGHAVSMVLFRPCPDCPND